jgi:hypothetical protein
MRANLKRGVVVAGQAADEDWQDPGIDKGIDWRIPIGGQKFPGSLKDLAR